MIVNRVSEPSLTTRHTVLPTEIGYQREILVICECLGGLTAEVQERSIPYRIVRRESRSTAFSFLDQGRSVPLTILQFPDLTVVPRRLDNLRQCMPSSIREILNELPANLDDTYERILRDIPKQLQRHAYLLFQCMVAAS